MCPKGTGASTCAGCKSLKSTRTDGRPLPTALQPPSSEVRAAFHSFKIDLLNLFGLVDQVEINLETRQAETALKYGEQRIRFNKQTIDMLELQEDLPTRNTH